MSRVRYLVGLATLAVAIGGGYWLVGLLGSSQDSEFHALQLEFRDSRSLKPGADVRHRGVRVGLVRRVALREDGQRAVIDVGLEPSARHLVRYGSRFWIVTPRFLGLTQGASGLDTLIRDSYVSFVSAAESAPELPSGSQLVGLERPPSATDAILEQVERGDLLMTLLVPESHDLVPGARVLFRGMQTGELRAMVLAGDGTHVRIELRIRRDHRHTVTDKTQFWVARPRLSGAFLTGLALEDAAALLSPFVGYHTEPGPGVPVADGHRAVALAERPEFKVGSVPVAALVGSGDAPPTQADAEVRLVRVFYEAVERDWFSPDDAIARTSTGLLMEDGNGRVVVITTRSACDGNYFTRDTFGAMPDIAKERILVALPEGTVLQAARTWTDAGDWDLAVLGLQDAPPTLRGTRLEQLTFTAEPGDASVRALDGQGAEQPLAPLTASDGAAARINQHRGGAVLAGGKVVGVLGQATGTEERAVVIPLARLPEALRPRR